MKRKAYEVPTRFLLFIAGVVWLIAGFNVARLGILAYLDINIQWYFILLSAIVFLLFGTMFFKITVKHSKRIKGYSETYRPFWYFFDVKSYIIMAVMMGGGIALRESRLMPDEFIAFFYSGLGLALALAGVLFIVNFIRYQKS